MKKFIKAVLLILVAAALIFLFVFNDPNDILENIKVQLGFPSSVETFKPEYEILEEGYIQPDTVKSLINPESKNILLVGVDESGILFDTICIASIDSKANIIKLIQIPRDAYVPYSQTITDSLKEKDLYTSKGMFKINASDYVGNTLSYPEGKFKDRGMDFLRAVFIELLGVDFSEYVIMSFDGFEKIVDAFGGVDVTVNCDLRNEKGQLVIPEGKQHLDGQQALFYARARHLYDENGNMIPTSGDTFRKENQVQMMTEMLKEMATPSNVTKLPDVLNTLKKEVKSSFSTKDILNFSTTAVKISKGDYTIESHVITGTLSDPMNDGASYVTIS
ncbi:MAG: LCP family protein [Clostridiales bacterium]|jgi:LCP family protein required for cell wall assembly|nr:LCP family protein [Clostridiales bacterium]